MLFFLHETIVDSNARHELYVIRLCTNRPRILLRTRRRNIILSVCIHVFYLANLHKTLPISIHKNINRYSSRNSDLNRLYSYPYFETQFQWSLSFLRLMVYNIKFKLTSYINTPTGIHNYDKRSYPFLKTHIYIK